MSDPTRLIDEAGGDELEASLLKLAKNEGPSAEGRRRILAAIAAGSAASLTTEATQAATKASSKAAVKWGVIGAGVAALAIPAALLLGGGSKEPAAPRATPQAAPVPRPEPRVEAAPKDEGPAPLTVDDLPALKEQPSAGVAPAAPKQASLAEEVAQLQKAKLALKGGNPSQALAELGVYQQRFPRPMLGAEATVVRIEALSQSGDAARAKSLAEGFLAKNPNSPYAARLRSLTGAR